MTDAITVVDIAAWAIMRLRCAWLDWRHERELERLGREDQEYREWH
mgnify:CR=1 FL=1